MLRQLRSRKQPFILNGYTINVCSKAGVGTWAHVKRKETKLSICFDVGLFDESTASVSHVFISHTHTDHMGAMFLHARSKCRGRKGNIIYVVPASAVANLRQIQKAYEALDGGTEFNMDIVGAWDGSEFDVGKHYRVKAFKTAHRVSSLGYLMYRKCDTQDKQKNYADICYTGDTTFEGLRTVTHVWTAKILMMELTFLCKKTVANAESSKHIHISQVVENTHLFQNEVIIMQHISTRYSPAHICEHLITKLPTMLGRLLPALMPFGVDNPQLYWELSQAVTLQIPAAPEYRFVATRVIDLARIPEVATYLLDADVEKKAPIAVVLVKETHKPRTACFAWSKFGQPVRQIPRRAVDPSEYFEQTKLATDESALYVLHPSGEQEREAARTFAKDVLGKQFENQHVAGPRGSALGFVVKDSDILAMVDRTSIFDSKR